MWNEMAEAGVRRWTQLGVSPSEGRRAFEAWRGSKLSASAVYPPGYVSPAAQARCP